jgi:DNA-binding transcriptional ArsR family regulator
MFDDDDDRRVLHPDATQLRALAHPLRSRLLGALRFHGPATATALAARLGTNTGVTSYHLRQLADVGLVEDDLERSNGRDRWWRAAHDATAWRSDEFDDDPDARAAEDWLLRRQAHVAGAWLDDWLSARQDWPTEWRAAADQSDYHVTLTPDGLRALMDDLHEVVRTHQRAADPARPGAERVTVLLQAFPSAERSA